MNIGKTCAALGAALLFLSGCTSDQGESDSEKNADRSSAASSEAGVPLAEAVSLLKVEKENHEGYDRDKFRLYTDDDADGCNARYEVLIEEAVQKPKVSQPGCELSGGQWKSYFDGKTANSSRDISIDHMVALSEAWDSGARNWPEDKLVEYGNYLDRPEHLVGVTPKVNSEKSDQDPSEWLPPVPDVHCRYISEFVSVKVHWDLSVDKDEKGFYEWAAQDGGLCADTRVPVS